MGGGQAARPASRVPCSHCDRLLDENLQHVHETKGSDSDAVASVTPAPRPWKQGDVRAASLLPWRHNIGLLAFACLLSCYCLRINVSVAATSMREQFHWTETQMGIVLSSFFFGYICNQATGGSIASRHGAKAVLMLGIAWPAIVTILTPLWASNFWVLVMSRVVMGFGESVVYPATFVLLGEWIPDTERATWVSMAMAGANIGIVLGLASGAPMVQHLGWPSVFLWFGLAAMLWCLAWWLYGADSPATHPYVSKEEVEYIRKHQESQDHDPIPWYSVMQHRPALALIFVHFTFNWFYYTWLTWMPAYFQETLHFPLAQSGVMSFLPYIMQFLLQVGCGRMQDALLVRGYSKTKVRNGFLIAGVVPVAVCCASLGFVKDRSLAACIVIAAASLWGVNLSSFFPTYIDMAPHHSGVLMGISNTFATLPGMISPFLTGVILDATGSWVIVFNIMALLASLGCVVYVTFCDKVPVIGVASSQPRQGLATDDVDASTALLSSTTAGSTAAD